MGQFSMLESSVENVVGTIDVNGCFGISVLRGDLAGVGSPTLPADQVIEALEGNEIVLCDGLIITYLSFSRDAVKVVATGVMKGVYAVFNRDEFLKFLKDSKK